MLDAVIDFSPLEEQLSSYLTDENSKRIKLHISFFKRLLLRHSVLRNHCHSLLQDVHSLFCNDYWLKLEVLAQSIPHKDDLMFRVCLFHFASAITKANSRPSSVFVFDTNIDLLHWYRKNFHLGKELNDAISAWNKRSTLARSTTRSDAQKAQKCLKLLCEAAPSIAEQVCEHGLLWFTKLKRVILKYIAPTFKDELSKYGVSCLGMKKNRIQKAVFQQLQSDVKAKVISVRSGTSYTEAIRWLMSITGQQVVEAFKISFKRHQRHARRAKMEDLYSDDELRELIFYIEKGIKETDNVKQLLALYFARIQVKSCWNTSPMTDIELSDIADVALPTAKKSITLLIQKPRKGYDIDTYSLDGRTVNSVMRDIVYVKDTLTHGYRHLGDQHTQNYLFIFKEKTNVSRVLAGNIIAHIKSILNRFGCTVNYDSMRIRKNGANHLYRDVAKQMRAYESAKLHTFDTFIKHYQRVSEQKTQQTLHTAVDVMQRYFMGREIDPEIKVLMVDDGSTQKTPTGECASHGYDAEASQHGKEHRHLSGGKENGWCSDFLACVWCKHFRTVADPEHVWQLLSYRDYVLADMSASISDIENNEFQQEAITALHQRVDDILEQVAIKNPMAVTKGKELMAEKGMHPFWAFAVTSVKTVGDIL
nr:hypothetical protein [uncultured Moellerella sp.]